MKKLFTFWTQESGVFRMRHLLLAIVFSTLKSQVEFHSESKKYPKKSVLIS